MTAVDTNILFYARDPRDPTKKRIASSLLKSASDGVLLWQVACEYMAVAHKLVKLGCARTELWQDVLDLAEIWPTVMPSWKALDRAEGLLKKYKLSFWDASIVSACLEAGISRLYTEDFSAYPHIEGLEIVNPFRVS